MTDAKKAKPKTEQEILAEAVKAGRNRRCSCCMSMEKEPVCSQCGRPTLEINDDGSYKQPVKPKESPEIKKPAEVAK